MTHSEANTLYALLALEVILGGIVAWTIGATILGYDSSALSLTYSLFWAVFLWVVAVLVLIVWPVWLMLSIARGHQFIGCHLMAHGLITIILPFNLITAAGALWMGHQKRRRRRKSKG